MKIVINNCFGGYGLSQDFLEKYGEEFNSFERNDPKLVAAVEEFGESESSGFYSNLRIREIPDDFTEYEIENSDRKENMI